MIAVDALNFPAAFVTAKKLLEAGKAVSRAESIRKYRVLENDFTIDNGYLTPSLKVKRSLVLKDFADQVDAIYG